MMNGGTLLLTLVVLVFMSPFINSAYGQEIIDVNQTTPCFLNYTAGVDMWRNCGMGEDYLNTAFMGWEYVTGGFFSALLVSIFIMFTYIKYHKALYPVLIGIAYLPTAYFLFPVVFITWAIVMVGVTFGIIIWYIFIKQTKEY